VEPSGEPTLRVLNACEACGRQYDVSHLAPGTRVRCGCGAAFGASFHRPRAPRSLRCSSCGGEVGLADTACGYCRAEITLEERRLTSICPSCFARVLDRARYCMECGVTIQPQALYALPESASCPRCRGELRGRELSGSQVVECPGCGGLWLSPDHFEQACATADARERVAAELRQRPPPARPDEQHPPRYLPCVACGELMHRRNYASISGVVIDVCRHHGVWLDHAELEKILAFVRAGGLDRARARELERLREERRRKDHAAADPPLASLVTRRPRYALGDELIGWLVESVLGLWR
jgi:Zn-finger nucleic acid-binding protein